VAFGWPREASERATRPNGRAYLTVGGLEEFMVSDMQHMADTLRRDFPTLAIGSRAFPDETHASVVPGALSRALRFLYGDYGAPEVALSRADVAAYAGEWRSADGTRITLRPAGTGLSLRIALGEIITDLPLVALSRDRLFSRRTDATITAERDPAGRVVALRTRLTGSEQRFARVR
jgi:hypothetical protein